MKSPLVEKWFHSIEKDDDTCTVVYQGQILEEPSSGIFLVQRYEWLMGHESDQALVPFSDMAKCKFYDSHTDMRESWDRIRATQGI